MYDILHREELMENQSNIYILCTVYCKYVYPTRYRKEYLRILYQTVPWYLASESKPVLLWILF
jgi:hypothetical protein